MRMPKRGEKGFTLIELLIVVAILGVLAAVVIPNVGRFIGRGESEASETELSNIQSAVVAMMVDNEVSALPNPVTTATNNMEAFPDATTNSTAKGTATLTGSTDKAGYLLYQHEIGYDSTGNGIDDSAKIVNYTATKYTKGTYTLDSAGTVNQTTTGYE